MVSMICFCATADRAIVAEGKARGCRLVVWPCNTPEALEMALAFEPGLICTDESTAIRARYNELRAVRGWPLRNRTFIPAPRTLPDVASFFFSGQIQ
jgi:hypothetical protein